MMTIVTILSRLGEAAALTCSSLRTNDQRLYTVPIEHRRLGAATPEAARLLAGLPPGRSFDELRCLLKDGPLGLFAPKLRPLCDQAGEQGQRSWGAIVVLAPTDWQTASEELASWQFDGVEAAFAGLPYSFDDVLVFAGLNFSPDCWFTVLAGPMAGKVFWWTHDGDVDLTAPWADNVREWADRVWREVPEVFGGIIRFESRDSSEPAPPGAELYPEKLVRVP